MLGTAQVITFVATTDAEKARVFYEARLGLALVGDEASALVFDMHGVMLRVLKVEAVTPAEHAVLGWKVMDIEATIEGLGSKGVVFERFPCFVQDSDGVWVSPSGAKVAWFRDPDGNVLSLTQPRGTIGTMEGDNE